MQEDSGQKDKPNGREPEEPELRRISPEELEEILESHRRWIESEGKEGERANLSATNLLGTELVKAELQEANLRGAYLAEANLQEADLMGADLQGTELVDANLKDANLVEANLQEASLMEADLQGTVLVGANLQRASLTRAKLQEANLMEADLQEAFPVGANLQEADLAEAKLRDSNLQDADLTGARGLLAGQLAGANVSGAKLPEDIYNFEEPLKNVEEASKNARKLFFGLLAGCLYAVLTIATTTDARLVSNSASSPLPIIGTQIPIVGFYLAAPLLLLAVYIYFHLYLQRLWEGLARLPAILPDGRSLDERA